MRGGYETLGISLSMLLDAGRGIMTTESADKRLIEWSAKMLDLVDMKFTVTGRENIDPSKSYLLMSNHASHFDIPVLYQAYRRPLRMVAKKELYRIPFFGPAMRAAGFPEVDRGNRAKAVESLRQGSSLIESGVSLWIAPEGTRSRDGTLQPYKKGGFVLALESSLVILPLGLAGTRDVLAPSTLTLHRGVHVHAHFGAPIVPSAEGYSVPARDALMATVRASMVESIAYAQAQRGA